MNNHDSSTFSPTYLQYLTKKLFGNDFLSDREKVEEYPVPNNYSSNVRGDVFYPNCFDNPSEEIGSEKELRSVEPKLVLSKINVREEERSSKSTYDRDFTSISAPKRRKRDPLENRGIKKMKS